MFSNLRKRINSVYQEGRNLSENLQNVYKPSNNNNDESFKINTSESSVKYLKHYERVWKEIHDGNEENVKVASHIDTTIIQLKQNSAKTLTNISDFNESIISLPTINECLKLCAQLAKEIGENSKIIEQKLCELEDLKEVLELQEKQLDHRFEMALYKNKKLAAFDRFRQELVDKHANDVKKLEQQLSTQQQERHAVFDDAFKNDLDYYKSSGSIPKVDLIKNDKEVTLDEIILEQRDTEELDNFLNN